MRKVIVGEADKIFGAVLDNITFTKNTIFTFILCFKYVYQSKILWHRYEKMLNEMLSHLERQPRNKERCIGWLQHIEPLFNCLGLVLLAHFRRLFPLFFKWMHADDDRTVLLVLERIKTVVKLTWIRNSPHIERLVDELVSLYKEAALKIARVEIRKLVLQTLILIHQSKGSQFKAVWDKHKDDPDLTVFHHSFSEQQLAMNASHINWG